MCPLTVPSGTNGRELDYRLLDRFGPWLMIGVFLATSSYGVLIAMPALYDDRNMLRGMQAVICYCLLQLSAHWLTTRHVSSTFAVPPADINEAAEDKTETNSQTTVTANGKSTSGTETSSRTVGQISKSNQRETNQHGIMARKWMQQPEPDVHQEKKKQYWSWHYCWQCRKMTPPRCHHCSLCQKCVLKRDHHCFLTGTCIGVNNQKYFTIFIFWAVVNVTFGILHMYAYLYHEIIEHISLVDFLPVICFFRGLAGKVPWYFSSLTVIFWGLNAFTVISYALFFITVRTLIDGRTKFEIDKNMIIHDSRTFTERLRETLGNSWFLSFLVPFRISSGCREDAVQWPSITGTSDERTFRHFHERKTKKKS